MSAITRGFQSMRNDSRLIAQLFRNLSTKQVGMIQEFVKREAFDLCLNYPTSQIKIPAFVILLKSEKEFQAFLGDSMGIEMPDIFSYEGNAGDNAQVGVASTTTLAGNGQVVYGPAAGFTGTENTIRVSTRAWSIDQYMQGGVYKIRIVDGTGKGQIRDVTGNSNTMVMVSPPWKTIPDDTSVFEITRENDDLVGEPWSLYDRNDGALALERKGGIYDMTYQVQVIGPNPELTVYLSIILKAVLTKERMSLEGQGLMNFALSATDFVPKQEYLPTLAYVRAVNIDFQFLFDTFEQLVVPREFRLVLEGQPDGSVLEDPILSDTTFSLDRHGVLVDDLSDVNRIYFGTAVPPVTVDEDFVLNTLTSSLITSKRQHNLNFVANVGEKIYLAMPARFGLQSSYIRDGRTSLMVGTTLVGSFPVTTAFGTETYSVLASNNESLGYVPLVVI